MASSAVVCLQRETLERRARSAIDNLGLVSAYSGDALGQQMASFREMAQELPQAK